MSARDELAGIISGVVHGPAEGTALTRTFADAIIAAGYANPKVLGYIVVDRGGVMVGNQRKHKESAQAFADEWTADCKAAGIDWDYRVATITEAAA